MCSDVEAGDFRDHQRSGVTLQMRGLGPDSGVYNVAADCDGNGIVDSTDYMRMKAHFLGTYNLFS